MAKRSKKQGSNRPMAREIRMTQAGGFRLVERYHPENAFDPKGMQSAKGKLSKFLTVIPGNGDPKKVDSYLRIGCLWEDSKPGGQCEGGTTLYEKVTEITKAKAKKLANKPDIKVTGSAKKALGIEENPQLLIISNPKQNAKTRLNKSTTGNQVDRAAKAYKRFHFTTPATMEEVDVPNGYPRAMMVIGELDRFDVKSKSGRKVSRKFKNPKPKLCTNPEMKDLFILGKKKLGVPDGIALRCDYSVPPHSGRNDWSRKWWHPHDTEPRVTTHTAGRSVRVSGPGLKVTPRGIEG